VSNESRGLVMFRIGQKVVCIDNKVRPVTTYPEILKNLKVNGIYHITKITHGGLGVHIAEIKSPEKTSFFSDRFRPVVERKTDISTFEKLLNTKNHKVDVEA